MLIKFGEMTKKGRQKFLEMNW